MRRRARFAQVPSHAPDVGFGSFASLLAFRSMSGYGVISEMPVLLFCRLAWAGAICSVRDEVATEPDGQIRTALAYLPVQSPQRKYFTSRVGQITSRTPAVLPHRGVLRNVINAGRDAVDACALLTNGAGADGEVVWS